MSEMLKKERVNYRIIIMEINPSLNSQVHCY